MTEQEVKECIAEVKYSAIPEKSKKRIMDVLYEKLYNSGWIPCSEKLPEEHDSMFAKLKGTGKWNDAMFERTSDDVNVTVEYENGSRRVRTLHTIDGKWKSDIRLLNFKAIAWKPLPEPYKEA